MTHWKDADLDEKFKEEACVHCVLFDKIREQSKLLELHMGFAGKVMKAQARRYWRHSDEIKELQILIQDMEHRLREAGL